jgi:hypothetical protein
MTDHFPEYLKRIDRRLADIERQIGNLKSAVISVQDYADLIAATATEQARTIMCAEGLTSGKQLLHLALRAYLNRPTFLSETEERQFMETCRRLVHDTAARVRTPGTS